MQIVHYQLYWNHGANEGGVRLILADNTTREIAHLAAPEFCAIAAILQQPQKQLAPNGSIVCFG